MTTAIAYAGGSYGTYLEWCLTSLVEKRNIISPFVLTGSSHRFTGNQIHDRVNWNIASSKGSTTFARLHPKISNKESLSSNLDQICKKFDNVIHLYPARDQLLLLMNNGFTKVWSDWWGRQFSIRNLASIDPNVIYNNWPVLPSTKIADVPNWVRREFLSFYLMPNLFDQVEWYHPDKWNNQKCFVITIKELLYQFESTMERIREVCNLTFVNPISALEPLHTQNLNNQKFLHEDEICTTIVDAILSNKELSWNQRSLVSEAWIQWELRKHGFEIRCNELDIFPTNSVQLIELLYQI